MTPAYKDFKLYSPQEQEIEARIESPSSFEDGSEPEQETKEASECLVSRGRGPCCPFHEILYAGCRESHACPSSPVVSNEASGLPAWFRVPSKPITPGPFSNGDTGMGHGDRGPCSNLRGEEASLSSTLAGSTHLLVLLTFWIWSWVIGFQEVGTVQAIGFPGDPTSPMHVIFTDFGGPTITIVYLDP